MPLGITEPHLPLPGIGKVHTLETTVAPAAGRIEPDPERVARRRAEREAARLEREATDHFRRQGFDVTGHQIPTADPAETHFWHSGWSATRARLAEALERCHESPRRVEAFQQCGADTWVMRHKETGDRRLASSRCHDRFCLVCQRARSRLLQGNVRKALTARDYLHVVLTIRHTDHPLAHQIDRIYRWFRRLRAKPVWRNYVNGGAAFLEVTRNGDTQRWHPHLHVIVQARYVPVKDYDGFRRRRPVKLPGLISTWSAVTGGSTNVRVDRITDKDAAAAEVAKYVTKPLHGSLFCDTDALDEFILALKGRRLCLTFGSWYKIRLAERSPDFDPLEWVPECRLVDLMARAEGGELVAALLLEHFSKGSPCQPRPPPHQPRLFPLHGASAAPSVRPS